MRGLFGTALAAALAAATATAGEPAAPIATDANIVTGLDASDSVSSAQLRLELAGLAEALRSPEVLAAVRRGRHGRIGFAVFLWYQRHFPVVAAWRVIASKPTPKPPPAPSRASTSPPSPSPPTAASASTPAG